MDGDSIYIVIKRMITLGKDPRQWVQYTVEGSPLNIALKEIIKNNENSRTKDISIQ
jgi:hypothetical protein